jgi:hypothetical protein
MPSTSHLHQPLVEDMDRHSRMTGSSTEAVWNGGIWIVPVGKEVAASCGNAAKFDACALALHSAHSCPPRCPRVGISITSLEALLQRVHTFLANFYVWHLKATNH